MTLPFYVFINEDPKSLSGFTCLMGALLIETSMVQIQYKACFCRDPITSINSVLVVFKVSLLQIRVLLISFKS